MFINPNSLSRISQYNNKVLKIANYDLIQMSNFHIDIISNIASKLYKNSAV